MSILIRLRMAISELHQKGLFPYSPKALLKAIEAVEFCYDKREISNDVNMFDEEYIEYVQRKEAAKNKKEEEQRVERESRKSNRPKKINVNSLFLQDIKAKEEREARRSEISKKRKRVLAKRARKKSKLNNTKTVRKDKDQV